MRRRRPRDCHEYSNPAHPVAAEPVSVPCLALGPLRFRGARGKIALGGIQVQPLPPEEGGPKKDEGFVPLFDGEELECLGEHLKSGQSWSGQIRPVARCSGRGWCTAGQGEGARVFGAWERDRRVLPVTKRDPLFGHET